MEADGLCSDIFQYMCCTDAYGTDLFDGSVGRFEVCLRDVYISFSECVAHKANAYAFKVALEQRRGQCGISITPCLGGPGEAGQCGINASSYYIWTSQACKHLPDPRLSAACSEDSAWTDSWRSEARRITDASKLRIPHPDFLPIAQIVWSAISLHLQTLSDGVRDKVAFAKEIDGTQGDSFAEVVLRLAGSGLLRKGRRKGAPIKCQGKTSKVVVRKSFRSIVMSLWNVRFKMLKANHLDVQAQALIQVGGHRAAVASTQQQTTIEKVAQYMAKKQKTK